MPPTEEELVKLQAEVQAIREREAAEREKEEDDG
jgi:hypothetical protein